MKTEHIVSSYNGILPEEYQQPFPELYEAIYQKDKQKIEEQLLGILKTTLERYPEKPSKEDISAKGAYNAMELLGVNVDMDYVNWLQQVKGETIDPYFEDNSVLIDNVHNLARVADLIFSVMYYVDSDPSPYTQQQILHALEEYKNGNYEFKISTLSKEPL